MLPNFNKRFKPFVVRVLCFIENKFFFINLCLKDIDMSYTIIDPERIKSWIFDRRVKKAIKKANKLQKLTKSKFVVLIVGGKPEIYRKTDLRKLINMRVFGKTKLEDLLKKTVHITTT